MLTKKEKKYLPKGYNPAPERYTQKYILEINSNRHKKKIEILGKPLKEFKKSDYGFQIRQYEKFLQAHKLKTKLTIVTNKTSKKEVREEFIETLKKSNTFIIINYKRKTIGQKGGGHISPVVAYDKKTDSFLIMDVNSSKYPWVWVKIKQIIKAMNTFDTVENRGYIIVSEN